MASDEAGDPAAVHLHINAERPAPAPAQKPFNWIPLVVAAISIAPALTVGTYEYIHATQEERLEERRSRNALVTEFMKLFAGIPEGAHQRRSDLLGAIAQAVEHDELRAWAVALQATEDGQVAKIRRLETRLAELDDAVLAADARYVESKQRVEELERDGEAKDQLLKAALEDKRRTKEQLAVQQRKRKSAVLRLAKARGDEKPESTPEPQLFLYGCVTKTERGAIRKPPREPLVQQKLMVRAETELEARTQCVRETGQACDCELE